MKMNSLAVSSPAPASQRIGFVSVESTIRRSSAVLDNTYTLTVWPAGQLAAVRAAFSKHPPEAESNGVGSVDVATDATTLPPLSSVVEDDPHDSRVERDRVGRRGGGGGDQHGKQNPAERRRARQHRATLPPFGAKQRRRCFGGLFALAVKVTILRTPSRRVIRTIRRMPGRSRDAGLEHRLGERL